MNEKVRREKETAAALPYMTETVVLQCHIRHESVSTEWTNQMRSKLRLGGSSVDPRWT